MADEKLALHASESFEVLQVFLNVLPVLSKLSCVYVVLGIHRVNIPMTSKNFIIVSSDFSTAEANQKDNLLKTYLITAVTNDELKRKKKTLINTVEHNEFDSFKEPNRSVVHVLLVKKKKK